MTPTKRMMRIAELCETQERHARHELLEATRETERAEAALAAVFDQCRQVAEGSGDLSLTFGRALIESGWLTAREREECLELSRDITQEKQEVWGHRRSRLDALARLIERLQKSEDLEAARIVAADIDDLVAMSGRREQLVEGLQS